MLIENTGSQKAGKEARVLRVFSVRLLVFLKDINKTLP